MTDEIKEAREQGQNEAWELVRKIELVSGYTVEELNEIFGSCECSDVLAENTYAEAAEKVKAWEIRQPIRVGDEYQSLTGECCVITYIEGATAYLLWNDGTFCKRLIDYIKENFTRTGRTLSVKNWLQRIGGK